MRNWTHLVPKTCIHPYGRRRAGAKTEIRQDVCNSVDIAVFVIMRLLMYKFCLIYLRLPGIFRNGKIISIKSEELVKQ